MSISPAYADLGGGLDSESRQPTARGTRTGVGNPHPTAPRGVCERHMFDPVSGWCGCGIRDDGKLAEGSPAWRAHLDSRMPVSQVRAPGESETP